MEKQSSQESQVEELTLQEVNQRLVALEEEFKSSMKLLFGHMEIIKHNFEVLEEGEK